MTGKRCCISCFSDERLKAILETKAARDGGNRGKCDYCFAENTPGLAPESLETWFSVLAECYTASESQHARPLFDLVAEDWGIFSSFGNARNLLNDILCGVFQSESKWEPHENAIGVTEDAWRELREEMAHRNRWFLNDSAKLLNKEFLRDSYDLLGTDSRGSLDGEETWYRARLCRQGGSFEPEDMGAPPCIKATHGRVNPAGIPYLYLASDPTTAVSEVRPHIGAKVCVAAYRVHDVRILDLASRPTLSPFDFDDGERLRAVRAGLQLMRALGDELSRPVSPDSTAFDYSLTQYLCEFAKSIGFLGVRYSSSVSKAGKNLALFSEDCAEIDRNSLECHEVKSIKITY